ncbi:MAG: metallophosphoesterase [Chloroflexi bacterium]|nr:metallophosphoesterase [Chloroflexota bacterium]
MIRRLLITLGAAALVATLLATYLGNNGVRAAGGNPTLMRGPYLGNPTTTTVQFIWVTDVPTDATVFYGIDLPYTSQSSSGTVSTTHAVALSGLLPGTHYGYTIHSGAVVTPLAGASFRTLRAAYDSYFTFAALGDSGSGDSHQYAVAGTLQRMQPAFVLHTGDVIYPAGEAANYGPRFFAPYSLTLATAPFFMSPGNHDYMQAGAAPYYDVFYLPSNDATGTESYYSFDYGNAHVVALDTNLTGAAAAAMTAWLAQDLAATTRFWKFVFFHHAIYSSGPHGSEAYVQPLRDTLGPIFEQYNVDIVFNGHDHTYERTFLRRDYVPAGRGVTYIVTGGGGAGLYSKAATNAWSAAFFSTPDYWHAVRVDVANCRLTLSAVKAPSDSVFDTHVLDRCNYLFVPFIFNGTTGLLP